MSGKVAETQDRVMQALEALRKVLEEEQERLNDPAVSGLAQLIGSDRLQLVKWMLGEVKKLEETWQSGEAPAKEVHFRRRGGERLPRGKSLPEKFYRPLILTALIETGGQGRAKEVLERVFEMAKPHLQSKDLENIPSGTGKRWHRKANWERYRMVRDGLLRSDSPQGIWELTEKGWEEAKKLLEREMGE